MKGAAAAADADSPPSPATVNSSALTVTLGPAGGWRLTRLPAVVFPALHRRLGKFNKTTRPNHQQNIFPCLFSRTRPNHRPADVLYPTESVPCPSPKEDDVRWEGVEGTGWGEGGDLRQGGWRPGSRVGRAGRPTGGARLREVAAPTWRCRPALLFRRRPVCDEGLHVQLCVLAAVRSSKRLKTGALKTSAISTTTQRFHN